VTQLFVVAAIVMYGLVVEIPQFTLAFVNSSPRTVHTDTPGTKGKNERK